MLAPGPIFAAGSTRAVESIDISLTDDDHGVDLRLGHDLSGYFGFAAIPPHVLFPSLLGHVIFERVAGYHGLAKLGLVDREEEHGLVGRQVLRQRTDYARGLRHAFDHQHA